MPLRKGHPAHPNVSKAQRISTVEQRSKAKQMHEHAVTGLALILLVGFACQWLAWRVRLPAIIFLLATGIIAGPVLGWLVPDDLLGDLLFPFVSLAVAIILFEGSLTLRLRDIPGLERVIRRLITYGVAMTWGITAVATHILLGFSWEVSFLFGALMTVTGPTVIAPLLRTVRPRENVAHILKWESILIDPIGAITAVLVYEFIVAGGLEGGLAAGFLAFGKIVVIGAVFGTVSSALLRAAFVRNWIPHYLQNFATLALVCAVFAASNVLEMESGLLSVTVMGICLANMDGMDLGEILDFKESLSILLISMLFIILAARMNPQSFMALGWGGLAVFGVIQFLTRPLSVMASTIGSKLSMPERHMLAWIAPRGIVAAAISALFAIRLQEMGYADASGLVSLTFLVIIGTVVLQSATARPIAKWLGVAEPEPEGFLIIGAGNVAQTVAQELVDNGFRVMLADQNWDRVVEARLHGLPAYWGNPVSEHAERHLDLTGIGKLLALTPYAERNALAAQYYRLEFGPENIYSVRTHRTENTTADEKAALRFGGTDLFDESVTYSALRQNLQDGAILRTTPLTEEFTYEDYLAFSEGGERRTPLFAVSPAGRIFPFTVTPRFTPAAGWRIIALIYQPPLHEETETA
jgi:CPA1 family monovalent cation:H+ antiporter